MGIGATGAYAAYNVYQAAAKDYNYRAAHNGENMDPTALDSVQKSAISRRSGETLKMAKEFVNVRDDKNENSKVDSFVRSRPEEKGNPAAARDDAADKAEKAKDKEDPVEKHMKNMENREDPMEKHMEAMAAKAEAAQEEKAGNGEEQRKAAAERISNEKEGIQRDRMAEIRAERQEAHRLRSRFSGAEETRSKRMDRSV